MTATALPPPLPAPPEATAVLMQAMSNLDQITQQVLATQTLLQQCLQHQVLSRAAAAAYGSAGAAAPGAADLALTISPTTAHRATRASIGRTDDEDFDVPETVEELATTTTEPLPAEDSTQKPTHDEDISNVDHSEISGISEVMDDDRMPPITDSRKDDPPGIPSRHSGPEGESMSSIALQGSTTTLSAISNNTSLSFSGSNHDGGDDGDEASHCSPNAAKRASFHSSFTGMPVNTRKLAKDQRASLLLTRSIELQEEEEEQTEVPAFAALSRTAIGPTPTLHRLETVPRRKKPGKTRSFKLRRFFSKEKTPDDDNSSQRSSASNFSARRGTRSPPRPSRSPPRRNFNFSHDGSTQRTKNARPSVPKRSLSSNSKGLLRWTSSQGRANSARSLHLTAQPKTLTSLNIFCSDMVSNDFIMTKLHDLETNPSLVQVELEDCLVTRAASEEIPHRLKDILALKDRDWKGITMVDELLDGWSYPTFQTSRQQFLQALGIGTSDDDNNNELDIPILFQTKIELTTTTNEEDELKRLTELIEEFQKDPGIVKLTLTTTNETSVELLKALTALLQCDNRDWEDLIVRLGEEAEDEEDNWSPEILEAMEELQKACKTKRVIGISGHARTMLDISASDNHGRSDRGRRTSIWDNDESENSEGSESENDEGG